MFLPLPSPLSVSFPMAAVFSNLLGTACQLHLPADSAWSLGGRSNLTRIQDLVAACTPTERKRAEVEEEDEIIEISD
ncbi:hypothetical protein MVEN_01744400 [Mycena venus]|uniref:Uncharacterized protein n=1 Tax=Mycena venus TaxID=2733690 RepID=A0A8H7CPU7_9AGAR|nr:hypothetical protein MVEN_01744400 [Mycena venus]